MYLSLIEALENSTMVDCLKELGLTEFASLFSGLDLEDPLQSTDNDTKFTVFAPPNELITNSNLGNLSSTYRKKILLGSHIVKREILSVEFFDGQKIKSLSPKQYIHVTVTYKRNRNANSDEVHFLSPN